MTVFPGDDVTDGLTFALAFRLPLCGYVTAAGRVVYTLEGPERFGFAYGTLPGIPSRARKRSPSSGTATGCASRSPPSPGRGTRLPVPRGQWHGYSSGARPAGTLTPCARRSPTVTAGTPGDQGARSGRTSTSASSAAVQLSQYGLPGSVAIALMS